MRFEEDIDDDLLREAMVALGTTAVEETVEEALRLYIKIEKEALAMRQRRRDFAGLA